MVGVKWNKINQELFDLIFLQKKKGVEHQTAERIERISNRRISKWVPGYAKKYLKMYNIFTFEQEQEQIRKF